MNTKREAVLWGIAITVSIAFGLVVVWAAITLAFSQPSPMPLQFIAAPYRQDDYSVEGVDTARLNPLDPSLEQEAIREDQARDKLLLNVAPLTLADAAATTVTPPALASGLTQTPTSTPQSVATNPFVSLPTDTPVPDATNTSVPLPTDTPMPEPTNTALPLPTNTFVPMPTNTPLPAPTNTPMPAPTNTAVPAPTNAPEPPKPDNPNKPPDKPDNPNKPPDNPNKPDKPPKP